MLLSDKVLISPGYATYVVLSGLHRPVPVYSSGRGLVKYNCQRNGVCVNDMLPGTLYSVYAQYDNINNAKKNLTITAKVGIQNA